MFKALILTQKPTKKSFSTLNRHVFLQKHQENQFSQKQTHLQHSLLKQSPNKCLSNKKFNKIAQSQQSPTNTHRNIGNMDQKMTKIKGQLKIFHQYRLEKIQHQYREDNIENKKQQILGLGLLKTTVLAILNLNKQNLNTLIRKLTEYQQQIEQIDVLLPQNGSENSKQQQKVTSVCQSQLDNKQQSIDLVVYFSNPILCGQFYKHCYRQLHVLTVYLKEAIILERQKSGQISYKDAVQVINHYQSPFTTLKIQDMNQIPIQKQAALQYKWIELPKCPDCLLKLQHEVSGINQKVLMSVLDNKRNLQNEKKSTKTSCLTCRIITQNRRQTEMNRKLSYEEGYSSANKSVKHAQCDDCKQKSDIWICMVCGSVGCGRYKNADAYKHFINSGHIITIDLETQRVWNYLSDCFSHKILRTFNQPKSQIKFPQMSTDQQNTIENSKIEAAFWQYCSIFSDQMQRQRAYYENIKKSQLDKFMMQKQNIQKIITQLSKQNEQKKMQLRKATKNKVKLSKKLKQLQKKVEQERQIFKQQQQCLSVNLNKNMVEKDQQILSRQKELQYLQKELEVVLLQLSTN